MLATLYKINTPKTTTITDEYDACPYCGGRVILDVTRGEYVCTSCGTVIDVLYLPPKYKR